MKSLKDDIISLVITGCMFFSVIFNIPILRQFTSFLFLSFVPGFILLKIIKLDGLSFIDNLILSVGLSIAFSMGIGLIINELFPIFGILDPLSFQNLVLILSIITLFLLGIKYYVTKKSTSSLSISIELLPKIGFLIFLPVLSILGAWYNNNNILILMIAIIAIMTFAIVFFRQFISLKLLPVFIVVIALSLLFHFSFSSDYLTGWDVFLEYHVFNITKINLIWDPNISFYPDTIPSMLSVTVLPTLYSNLTNIQGEWIFKIAYPLIYSIVPLTLYRTWEKQTGKLVAFLSTFLFMISPKFFDSSEMRQMIAEIFLALLLFVIVNKKKIGRKSEIFLIIFGSALVVSHYSTSYIFLFTIFFTWFFSLLPKKRKINFKKVSFVFVILFLVLTFSWYTYVSIAPTNRLLGFLQNISNTFFTDFFNFASRGHTLNAFVDPLSASSIPYIISNLIGKIPYLFMVIGFLGLFIKRIKNPELSFDNEYTLMMITNAIILSAVILIPNFGSGLETTRFFHLTLFLLAPLSILGGLTFFNGLKKIIFSLSGKIASIERSKAISFVCIVFVVIFIFDIGFVFEITGDTPSSPALGKIRMEMSNDAQARIAFFDFYVPQQDVFSAEWLSKMVGTNSKIYADDISKLKVLVGYGMFSTDKILTLNSDLGVDDGYIYLRYENNIDRRLRYLFVTERIKSLDTPEFSSSVNNSHKIYTNGFSEIYNVYGN